MHGTLALVLALSVVSAEHKAAKTQARRTPAANYHNYNGAGGGALDGDGFYLERDVMPALGCDECCDCCSDDDAFHHLFWRSKSTCNMVERIWYFPEAHGYYYFRPYNHNHIPLHQNLATQWGIDPRNPYSNEFFQGVYQAVEARHLLEEVPQPTHEIPAPRPPAVQPPAPLPPAAPAANASEGPSEPVVLVDPPAGRARGPQHIRFVVPAGHIRGQ